MKKIRKRGMAKNIPKTKPSIIYPVSTSDAILTISMGRTAHINDDSWEKNNLVPLTVFLSL